MPKRPEPAEFEWIEGEPVVCCIRSGLDGPLHPGYFGQLSFRCPWCGEIHFHGAVGPSIGDGDGQRSPHCAAKNAQGYSLREVKEPHRAGTLRKSILDNFKAFKAEGWRVPDEWHYPRKAAIRRG
jgi:hypothetical protein